MRVRLRARGGAVSSPPPSDLCVEARIMVRRAIQAVTGRVFTGCLKYFINALPVATAIAGRRMQQEPIFVAVSVRTDESSMAAEN